MSLKDYKLKQKNSRIEREKSLENEIEEMRKACTLEKYMSQVPEFISGTRKPLPSWKRSMLAQKIANEDMRRQEENLRVKNLQFVTVIPLQRKYEEKFHEWKSQRYPIRHKSKS
ncbi:unnamed protein product [Litomosoides sigmodontis]|uniref:Uncharacterized protein n=1 Tax=Litomosoides sigmodontis TaxID=42156 RepID=A0A3P7JL73_LITSI|nr:unnamed protein product [Litomosoides sigmodontis]